MDFFTIWKYIVLQNMSNVGTIEENSEEEVYNECYDI